MSPGQEQEITTLKNGLTILKERVEELIFKEGELSNTERGILKSAIQQIREHEEKIKQLKNEI